MTRARARGLVLALVTLPSAVAWSWWPQFYPPPICTITGTVEVHRSRHQYGRDEQVVVYLDRFEKNGEPKTHRMVARNRQLLPQVLVARAGDTLEIYNEDKFVHDLYSAAQSNTFFSSVRTGEHLTRPLDKPGPVTLKCHTHKHERADLLVISSPHYTIVTGGAFSLSVPSGDVQLTVWEPGGAEKPIAVRCRPGDEVRVEPVHLQAHGPIEDVIGDY